MRGFSRLLLKLLGWKTHWGVRPEDKCIILGVPHTSIFDFVISWLFWTSEGRKANILIKKELFFWPLGYVLNKMGGVGIDRSKGANIIRQSVQLFKERERLELAIAIEGTRKRTTRWKAGFHAIATAADVPVYLSSFDWGRKQISVWREYELTDDYKEDIKKIKDFYREKGIKGKFPENFTTDY